MAATQSRWVPPQPRKLFRNALNEEVGETPWALVPAPVDGVFNRYGGLCKGRSGSGILAVGPHAGRINTAKLSKSRLIRGGPAQVFPQALLVCYRSWERKGLGPGRRGRRSTKQGAGGPPAWGSCCGLASGRTRPFRLDKYKPEPVGWGSWNPSCPAQLPRPP